MKLWQANIGQTSNVKAFRPICVTSFISYDKLMQTHRQRLLAWRNQVSKPTDRLIEGFGSTTVRVIYLTYGWLPIVPTSTCPHSSLYSSVVWKAELRRCGPARPWTVKSVIEGQWQRHRSLWWKATKDVRAASDDWVVQHRVARRRWSTGDRQQQMNDGCVTDWEGRRAGGHVDRYQQASA